MLKTPRQATNLSLNGDLLAEAKSLGINLSEAANVGIAKAVAAEKAKRWKLENREAIESTNAYFEEHGLPLAQFRQL